MRSRTVACGGGRASAMLDCVDRIPPARMRMAMAPGAPAVQSETLARLLETLVNIPSETGAETAIADWVEARLARLAVGERLRSGNAVVWRGPRQGRPLLALAGHLDTVPANGNATARIQDGRLFGLGSSDMKSGDVVMLGLL